MVKQLKKVFLTTAIACIAFTGVDMAFQTSFVSATASAHCGGGGCHGGYYSSSSNYYYCGGHAAHYHNNGVCPYYEGYYNNTNSSSNSSNSSSGARVVSTTSTKSNSTVKSVQKKLNELGYSCGTADGILGSKTKKAIKHFQVDCGLSANGKITTQVKEALNL